MKKIYNIVFMACVVSNMGAMQSFRRIFNPQTARVAQRGLQTIGSEVAQKIPEVVAPVVVAQPESWFQRLNPMRRVKAYFDKRDIQNKQDGYAIVSPLVLDDLPQSQVAT